jgi:hypothetical protein
MKEFKRILGPKKKKMIHFFPLPGIFISLHLPEHARLRYIRHVDEDISSRMAVQRLPQTFLVQMMSDKSDTPPKYEQAIKRADLRLADGG